MLFTFILFFVPTGTAKYLWVGDKFVAFVYFYFSPVCSCKWFHPLAGGGLPPLRSSLYERDS